MIYDTDILIWVRRGNEKAAKLIEKDDDKYLSIHVIWSCFKGQRIRRTINT